MSSKKIVVLGATGPTGVEVVSQALQRGYQVLAFVRSPEKLASIKSENLQVVQGDVYSASDLSAAFKGCDAVLSALGVRGSGKTTFYEDTNKQVVEALQQAGVKRFIAVTAWYTVPSSHEPFVIKYMVKPLFIGNFLSSMAVMETDLASTGQDLDYTVVRPPRLIDGPSTQKQFVTDDVNVCVPSMSGAQLARGDLARFMLDELAERKFLKKMVAVATK